MDILQQCGAQKESIPYEKLISVPKRWVAKKSSNIELLPEYELLLFALICGLNTSKIKTTRLFFSTFDFLYKRKKMFSV